MELDGTLIPGPPGGGHCSRPKRHQEFSRPLGTFLLENGFWFVVFLRTGN